MIISLIEMIYFQLCVCEMILEQEGVYGGDVNRSFYLVWPCFFLIWLIVFLWKKEALLIILFCNFGCMSFDLKELYIRP